MARSSTREMQPSLDGEMGGKGAWQTDGLDEPKFCARFAIAGGVAGGCGHVGTRDLFADRAAGNGALWAKGARWGRPKRSHSQGGEGRAGRVVGRGRSPRLNKGDELTGAKGNRSSEMGMGRAHMTRQC